MSQNPNQADNNKAFVRTYWASVLTDFMAAMTVAQERGETIPPEITRFCTDNVSFVLQNNTPDFLEKPLAYHRETAYDRWATRTTKPVREPGSNPFGFGRQA